MPGALVRGRASPNCRHGHTNVVMLITSTHDEVGHSGPRSELQWIDVSLGPAPRSGRKRERRANASARSTRGDRHQYHGQGTTLAATHDPTIVTTRERLTSTSSTGRPLHPW